MKRDDDGFAPGRMPATSRSPLLRGVFLLLVALAWQVPAGATEYYVRPAAKKPYGKGNGLSYADAWSGLGTVRWRTPTSPGVGPGDTLWVCGTHRGSLVVGGSGAEGAPITIRGDLPTDPGTLLGSRTQSRLSDWTFLGSGLWATADASFPRLNGRAPGWALLGAEAPQNVSVLRETLATADRDGLGWWDDSRWRVVLRSSRGNPASVYGSIEIPYSYTGLHVEGRGHVEVRSLSIRYTRSMGVRIASSTDVALRGLEVRYAGGGRGADGGRAGDGIQIDGNSSRVTVESCRVSQCFDLGIAPQLFLAVPEQLHDVSIRDCTVDRCGGGIGVAAHQKVASEIRFVEIRSNTVTNSGYGWSGTGNSVQGVGIQLKQAGGAPGPSVRDVTVRDNLVDTFAWAGILAWKGNFLILGNVVRNGQLGVDADPARASAILIHGGEYATSQAAGEAGGVVAYNLLADNAGHGILVLNNAPLAPTELGFYDNVLADNGDDRHPSFQSAASNRITFQGNIVQTAGSVCLDGATFLGGGVESDYNRFYRPSGAVWRYRWRTYTLAEMARYVLDSGQDAHSVAAYAPVEKNRAPTEADVGLPRTYFLNTALAPLHGRIEPEGTSMVPEGGSVTYSILPDPGYAVADVRIDGVSVGAVSTYTLPSVTADATIEASFAPGGAGF